MKEGPKLSNPKVYPARNPHIILCVAEEIASNVVASHSKRNILLRNVIRPESPIIANPVSFVWGVVETIALSKRR